MKCLIAALMFSAGFFFMAWGKADNIIWLQFIAVFFFGAAVIQLIAT